ncbi:MAG: antibiotic biosynthesis monooxygenase [Pseudomonadota bacterium]
MTHARVWRFRPPEGGEQAFAKAYCADGRWAELFGRARGFLGTTLLRPAEPGGWWLTIDRWDSAADFDAFGEKYGDEYLILDAELDGIAGEEEFVGAFESSDAALFAW